MEVWEKAIKNLIIDLNNGDSKSIIQKKNERYDSLSSVYKILDKSISQTNKDKESRSMVNGLLNVVNDVHNQISDLELSPKDYPEISERLSIACANLKGYLRAEKVVNTSNEIKSHVFTYAKKQTKSDAKFLKHKGKKSLHILTIRDVLCHMVPGINKTTAVQGQFYFRIIEGYAYIINQKIIIANPEKIGNYNSLKEYSFNLLKERKMYDHTIADIINMDHSLAYIWVMSKKMKEAINQRLDSSDSGKFNAWCCLSKNME